MTLPPSPLRAALDYARQGRPVFPVWPPAGAACSCPEGEACGRPGKHPLGSLVPHGHLDATTDEARLMQWFTARPDANIAERTGPESGRFVVDVDPRNGGDVTLEELEARHGKLPYSLRARTGSGGQHIVFRYPNHGRRILSRTNALGPGLDVKGEGGYIVVAPSRHVSGGTYAWQDEEESHLEDAPEGLLELLCERQEGTGTEDLPDEVDAPPAIVARAKAYLAKIPGAKSGQHGHDQTFIAAVVLVRGFVLSVRQALPLLEADYNPRCKPPWTAKELRHKVDDARKNGRLPFGYLLGEKDPAGNAPPPPAGAPPVCATIDFLEAFRRRRRAIATRCSTDIPSLDEATRGGLSGGDVITFTGKPGSGKTTLAIQLAISRARKLGLRAYLYGPDQGWTGIFERLLGDAGIGDSLDALEDAAAEASFAPIAEELARLVVLCDETAPGATLAAFAALVHGNGDAAGAVIDSVQTAVVDEDEGERQRLDAVMDQAKRLADSATIPVLVVSQSNRASWASKRKEDRTDPMSSGRGSAAIEHRSQVLMQLEKLADGTFAVIVPKVALGKAGATFRLALDPTTWRLHEIDADAAEEEDRHAEEAKLRPFREAILSELRKASAGGERRSGRSIEAGVPGGAASIRRALKALVLDGEVFFEEGPRGSLLYYLASTASDRVSPRLDRVSDAVSPTQSLECVSASLPVGGDALEETRSARGKRAQKTKESPVATRRGQEVAG